MSQVDGGFFWMHEKPNIHITDDNFTVSRCVFYARPKWWHLRSWYRAWRAWLNLPHAES